MKLLLSLILTIFHSDIASSSDLGIETKIIVVGLEKVSGKKRLHEISVESGFSTDWSLDPAYPGCYSSTLDIPDIKKEIKDIIEMDSREYNQLPGTDHFIEFGSVSSKSDSIRLEIHYVHDVGSGAPISKQTVLLTPCQN